MVYKFEIAAVIVPKSMLVCIVPLGMLYGTAPHDSCNSGDPL
jgi:hypothetical protein